MDVFHWPGGAAPHLESSVAALGVLDGVHLGHQRMLAEVCAEARRRAVPSCVVTFDRHPHPVVGGPPEPFITSLAHRVRLLDRLGLDVCLVLEFTPQVAAMFAEDFARAVLRDMLGARLLIVGQDCRFGAGGRGDVAMLRRMEPELRIQARVIPTVCVDGEPVSSTAVRQAVRQGDLHRARRLLGRPFSLLGTVVRGCGRGRVLGYPTANLDVQNELIPPEGVYATILSAADGTCPSVTSIGRQETFQAAPGARTLVEVHVLDRRLDLYGRDVEVQFIRFLRGQRRYENADALAARIALDVEQARAALAGGEEPCG
jgi:riboflavin kinase/FMN adenylyltransferase